MALTPVQIAQASTYLKDCEDVTVRRRPLLGWADYSGRVNRNAKGKDWNWLLDYKQLEAEAHVPFQQGNFTDDNFYLPMAVTPVFWKRDSAMDITEIMQNTGPAQIVPLYNSRAEKLANAMEIYTAKSLYNDVNASGGSTKMTGLKTFAQKSGTIATTTGDRLAPPDELVTYAGQSIGLGSHGGSWSAPASGEVPMNAALGTNYPDGQSDPSQRYDCNSPVLYNQNTSRWADPSAAAASSTWETNCIAMLSRADTDLKKNTVESMMPNVHQSGSGRYQAVKDKMRQSFRYLMNPHGESLNLGYPEVLDFEGAALVVDHECPAEYTFSLCAASFDLNFYSADEVREAQMVQSQSVGGDTTVTGNIYVMFGPVRDPRGVSWLWTIFAGGQIRWTPKYITIHGDFVNNG